MHMGKTSTRRAWNNWYHCVGGTYGSWVRGDDRGWRARHHREHVDGDYKNPPPPGKYDKLANHSRRLMKRDRVILSPAARELACKVFAEALLFHQVELIDLCVGAKHWHALARFHPLGQGYVTKDRSARHLIGIAKKRSARALSDQGLVQPGGTWAVRCKVKPIADRAHELRVARYIWRHVTKGAAVYSVLTGGQPQPSDRAR
jgi:hypothetical protein